MAEECNNPWLHEYAHILRREGRTHTKPQKVLMLVGYVIRSQPMRQGVRRVGDRVGEALQKAVAP